MLGAPLTGLAALLACIGLMPESSPLPAQRSRWLWPQPCSSLDSEWTLKA